MKASEIKIIYDEFGERANDIFTILHECFLFNNEVDGEVMIAGSEEIRLIKEKALVDTSESNRICYFKDIWVVFINSWYMIGWESDIRG